MLLVLPPRLAVGGHRVRSCLWAGEMEMPSPTSHVLPAAPGHAWVWGQKDIFAKALLVSPFPVTISHLVDSPASIC